MNPGSFPIVYDALHDLHDPPMTEEVAQRGHIMHQAVQAAGLGVIVPPRDRGLDPIKDVHDPAMIQFLQTVYDRMKVARGEGAPVIPGDFPVFPLPRRLPRNIWGQLGYYCSDVYSPVLAGTWRAAYLAAQVALTAAQTMLEGASVAYALCRPPGHHAYPSLFGGFCYLNNAAIAAQWLTRAGQRVAILDIDYHHGNGTQHIFYLRSDVLVCSIHADPADEYPYYVGFAGEKGSEDGEGFNVNVPLPLGTSPEVYLDALESLLQRVIRFSPDLLLISLGFDTFEGDPVGGFLLQTDTFERIGIRCRQLSLPTLVVQEGGYLLEHLGENCVAFLSGLTR